LYRSLESEDPGGVYEVNVSGGILGIVGWNRRFLLAVCSGQCYLTDIESLELSSSVSFGLPSLMEEAAKEVSSNVDRQILESQQ